MSTHVGSFLQQPGAPQHHGASWRHRRSCPRPLRTLLYRRHTCGQRHRPLSPDGQAVPRPTAVHAALSPQESHAPCGVRGPGPSWLCGPRAPRLPPGRSGLVRRRLRRERSARGVCGGNGPLEEDPWDLKAAVRARPGAVISLFQTPRGSSGGSGRAVDAAGTRAGGRVLRGPPRLQLRTGRPRSPGSGCVHRETRPRFTVPSGRYKRHSNPQRRPLSKRAQTPDKRGSLRASGMGGRPGHAGRTPGRTRDAALKM